MTTNSKINMRNLLFSTILALGCTDIEPAVETAQEPVVDTVTLEEFIENPDMVWSGFARRLSDKDRYQILANSARDQPLTEELLNHLSTNYSLIYDSASNSLIPPQEVTSPQTVVDNFLFREYPKILGYSEPLDNTKPLVVLFGEEHQIDGVNESNKLKLQEEDKDYAKRFSAATATGNEGLISPYVGDPIKSPLEFELFDRTLPFNGESQFRSAVGGAVNLLNSFSYDKMVHHVDADIDEYGIESADLALYDPFAFVSYGMMSIDIFTRVVRGTNSEFLRDYAQAAIDHYSPVLEFAENYVVQKYNEEHPDDKINVRQLRELVHDTKFVNEHLGPQRDNDFARNFPYCLEKDSHHVGFLVVGLMHLSGTVRELDDLGYNWLVVDNSESEKDNEHMAELGL